MGADLDAKDNGGWDVTVVGRSEQARCGSEA